MIRANKLTQLEGSEMLAKLAKTAKLTKSRFWRNFAKVVDEMIKGNK